MDTYLDYARRGRNDWWRYLLTIVLAVVIWIALVVAITVGLTVSRLMPVDIKAEMATPAHPLVFYLGNGLAFGALVLGFVIAMRLLQGKRFVDVIGAWRWSRFWAGLGIWTACLVATTLLDVALRPGGFRWSATAATASLAVTALIGLGVQTFAEEFIFRGYLTQGLLLATKRPVVAAILSGLVFGSLHIPTGIPQALNAVLFGMVAAPAGHPHRRHRLHLGPAPDQQSVWGRRRGLGQRCVQRQPGPVHTDHTEPDLAGSDHWCIGAGRAGLDRAALDARGPRTAGPGRPL